LSFCVELWSSWQGENKRCNQKAQGFFCFFSEKSFVISEEKTWRAAILSAPNKLQIFLA
jgi:hypothetical protein